MNTININSTDALISSLISVGIGFGIPYYFYIKYVHNKYKDILKESKTRKLEYWTLRVALIVTGINLMNFIDTWLSPQIQGYAINTVKFNNELIKLTAFSVLFGIVYLALRKSANKNKNSSLENKENPQQESVTGTENKKYFATAISLLILIAFLAFNKIEAFYYYMVKQKIVAVSKCINLTKPDNTTSNGLNKLLITKNNVTLYSTINGKEWLTQLPDANISCIILDRDNFRFQCNSFTFISGPVSSGIDYDGAKTVRTYWRGQQNDPLNNETICETDH